ncbi:AMP-binding protein [Chitinimonas koreensis]|uniref:AMP-binding protein n=1 Tax=Chitinimonas koreensis TaxID=356302 RepID=UPI00040EE47F|nr:AMP-binding protein [Chitinimonas koreensis]QNM97365.1 AMP-binding protein [Chitinimonas koreensis]
MRFDPIAGCFRDDARDPARLAVAGEDGELSWAGLRAEAEAFRDRLVAADHRPGRPLAVIGHKQTRFVAAVCGCLLHGSPWIPLDTIYPEARIERIVALGGAGSYRIDGDQLIAAAGEPTAPIEPGLAYIVFTSGSTGEPKGVQIPRTAVASLLQWMDAEFGIGDDAVWMNQAPFSFDLSMYELLHALWRGAALVLNSRAQVADPAGFLARLRRHGVTTWVSTPSFAWQQVLSDEFAAHYLDRLDTFLFCGEILPNRLVRQLHARFPQARVLNSYGPTEATVATTLVEITPAIAAQHDPLPVGRPKPGCELLIDPASQEITIVGEHVMAGYLNRPELNQERLFLHGGRRAFRTGDAGRLVDGMLFCHGRLDSQVKLNGYRVELGEIEAVLEALPAVARAAVIAIMRGGQCIRLVAYLVPAEAEPAALDPAALDRAVAAVLPAYMRPAEYRPIDALPANANQKTDRQQLLRLWQANPNPNPAP